MAAVDGYQNANESGATEAKQQEAGSAKPESSTASSTSKPAGAATGTAPGPTTTSNSTAPPLNNKSAPDAPTTKPGAASATAKSEDIVKSSGGSGAGGKEPSPAGAKTDQPEQPGKSAGAAGTAAPEQAAAGKDSAATATATTPKQQDEQSNKQQGGEGGGGGAGEKQQATAGIPGRDDERKLFVGGLTRNTTESELKEYFGKFGEIESVSIKMDPYTGLSRGFAFMVFQNPKAIDKLLASGDHYINKRKVDPKRVSKKAQHGKIFVGGLTPEITDEDIKNYFGQYGTIVEVQAPFDKTKNQRRSYCFVTFDSKDVVYKLLKTPKQTINGKEVDVKKVKVNQDQRQGFWGPQYGGFGYGGYSYIPDYNGYPSYDDMYNNYEYAGYGYDSMYGIPGKPRPQGPRQFQRHQPY